MNEMNNGEKMKMKNESNDNENGMKMIMKKTNNEESQ